MRRGHRPMGRGKGADMQSGAMGTSVRAPEGGRDQCALPRAGGAGHHPRRVAPARVFSPRLFPNRRPFPARFSRARLLQSGGLAELLHRWEGGTRRAPPSTCGALRNEPRRGLRSPVCRPGEGRRLPGEPGRRKTLRRPPSSLSHPALRGATGAESCSEALANWEVRGGRNKIRLKPLPALCIASVSAVPSARLLPHLGLKMQPGVKPRSCGH